MIASLSYFIYVCVVMMIFFVDIDEVVWVTVLIAAIIIGSGAGVFWVGQGTYMSLTIDESVRNYYMGMFYGVYAS